jgi:hypothetical protein
LKTLESSMMPVLTGTNVWRLTRHSLTSILNTQRHFKGITLHLLARIIAWSLAPVEIKLI